jgi:hypothetical protein
LVGEKNLAVVGWNEPHYLIERGGFAGTVWPEEPHDFALVYFDRHIVDHGSAFIGLKKMFGSEL